MGEAAEEVAVVVVVVAVVDLLLSVLSNFGSGNRGWLLDGGWVSSMEVVGTSALKLEDGLLPPLPLPLLLLVVTNGDREDGDGDMADEDEGEEEMGN